MTENIVSEQNTGDRFRRAQSLVVEHLDLSPQETDATKRFGLWKRKLEIYLRALEATEEEKFNILINRLGLNSYEYVDATTTYTEAIQKLENVYSKKINKIYARWKLTNEKQKEGESMDAFANRLMILAKDCNYTDVTAVEYKEEAVLQSFVSGLEDSYVRQRILEKDVVDLESALKSAEILKRAKTDAGCYEEEKYQSTVAAVNKLNFRNAVAAVDKSSSRDEESPEEGLDRKACFDQVAAVSRSFKSNYSRAEKCHNCGFQHPAKQCPAVGKTCFTCGRRNHFSNCCKNLRKSSLNTLLAASEESKLCNVGFLKPSSVDITINGVKLNGLLDTGASDCFITSRLAKRLGLKINKVNGKVKLADKDLTSEIRGKVHADMILGDEKYLCKNVEFTLLDNLVKEVIVGLKVLKKHRAITLKLDGKERPLNFKPSKASHLSVMCSNVEFPTLFPGINQNTNPVRMPSRKYSKDERNFIEKEIKKLLQDDVIEESISPWRSQVVVVKQKEKWRLCIDYSQTVNKHTELDAFPVPRIEDLVNELSKNRYFSKYDLKNAYHQVPLHPNDRRLTAFEANGKLLQFKRIPFGLTNAVGAFQRVVAQIIEEDKLTGIYPYLDDVTVAGNTLEELKDRSQKFENALKNRNVTLNEDKTVREVEKITVL